ncbi:MAG: PA2779 family protein [Deltaproteobacteria bacterium]|nr:PA2779 family protein [Deltaproteobacteria bacterium]
MKRHLSRFFIFYLAFSFLCLSAVPSKSLAYVVESGSHAVSRQADMDKVQRVLESKVVSDRLEKLGLGHDEVASRIEKLSDEELHRFASQVDSLFPGGDMGIVIGLLVIVILVIVILQLTGHRIILEPVK